MVALNPITKYPLAVSPVNAQLEDILSLVSSQKTITRIMTCLVSGAAVLLVSILVPGFHIIMALLGSLFSFTVSVMFPEVCYLVLFGNQMSRWQIMLEMLIILIGTVCAVLGTVWSFIGI